MDQTTNFSQLLFKSAFDYEKGLKKYYPNNLAIFTLGMYLRVDDLDEFAANSITDGGDDKKVDIFFIDANEERAIIAQSYLADKWGKKEAPGNKASDLNTAMAWLLSSSEDVIPEKIRDKAKELRSAISQDIVKRIEILYIHNCWESKNVEKELKTVADSTYHLSNAINHSPERPVVVSFREFGLRNIEDLFKSRDSEILVDGWIDVPINDYIQENGLSWKSILAVVPGRWVRDLYTHHGDRLFSANYRDYMGQSKQRNNINYQISQTAEAEPGNFFIYNNGITALTHELSLSVDIKIRGISIINGAQTSGALGETPDLSEDGARVLIRLVECNSPELVDKIIRYNNTQNEIKPADRRSNDQIQKRLREDFAVYGVSYLHRRSATRTPKSGITTTAIAPALCAFHGDPQTAYRNAKEIFNNDETYQRVFPNSIRVEHIFLVRTLSVALDRVKLDLNQKVSSGQATSQEEKMYDTMKHSASKHFLFYVFGSLAEEIMGRKVANLREWKSRESVIAPENMSLEKSWVKAINAILPLVTTTVEKKGKDAFYEVPRSSDLSKEVAQELKPLLASLSSVLSQQFKDLRSRTSI